MGLSMYDLDKIMMEALCEEQTWFQTNRNTPVPENLAELVYQADLGNEPRIILTRILEVMEMILEVPRSSWLSENAWRDKLPQWLQSESPNLSREELEKRRNSAPREQWHELPWQFDGWLHGMQCRGWRWSGYTLNQTILTVYLVIDDSPVYEGALEHLLRAAGAKDVMITAPNLSS